ncbi:mucin-2-like [Xyrauchen texanus]|uniref:mucin-2-like n=1 Tax=Xyrauchen texanus TaxID=154827 RepID=UPI002241F68F|nr:mucin-2-like [Xyrauchen texanus]
MAAREVHGSIVLSGQKLSIQHKTGRFHCPVCRFQTGQEAEAKAHIVSHLNIFVDYKGVRVYKCHQHCRASPHFHCPGCKNTRIRRKDFLTHLSNCPGSVNTPSPGSVTILSPGSVNTPSPGSVTILSPGSVNTPSPGSVTILSPGSVYTPSPGSVAILSPGSVNTPSPGSVTILSPGSVTIAGPGSVKTPIHGSVTIPSPGSVNTPSPDSVNTPSPDSVNTPSPGSVTILSPGSVNTPNPGSVTIAGTGNVKTHNHGSVTTPSPGSVTTPSPGSVTTPSPGSVTILSPGIVFTQSPGSVATPSPGSVSILRPGSVTIPSPGNVEEQPGSLLCKNVIQRPARVNTLSQRIVECPHCNMSMHRKNLKRHVQRRHSEFPDITKQCHLQSLPIDPQSGIYVVAKAFCGPPIPIHIKYSFQGPKQHTECVGLEN